MIKIFRKGQKIDNFTLVPNNKLMCIELINLKNETNKNNRILTITYEYLAELYKNEQIYVDRPELIKEVETIINNILEDFNNLNVYVITDGVTKLEYISVEYKDNEVM